jgi:hypothetical protein
MMKLEDPRSDHMTFVFRLDFEVSTLNCIGSILNGP